MEQVAWDDLIGVAIMTTDAGPAAPDVFWLLVGHSGGCVVLQGATGEKALMDRLLALPGFNFESALKAMVSTDKQRFVCWEKAKAPIQ